VVPPHCGFKRNKIWRMSSSGMWLFKNRRFGETYHLYHQGEKNQRTRNNVSSN
jgi:hypothetical protein